MICDRVAVVLGCQLERKNTLLLSFIMPGKRVPVALLALVSIHHDVRPRSPVGGPAARCHRCSLLNASVSYGFKTESESWLLAGHFWGIYGRKWNAHL